jgi:HK97 family phage portal protein
MMATTTQTSWSSADGFAHAGRGLHPLARYLDVHAGYDLLFERQSLVTAAVNKLTGLHVQLPRKVYRRARAGREDAGSTPYGRVITSPSSAFNPHHFWSWFVACHHVHGRAFAKKVRGVDGVTVGLELVHPTRMRFGPPGGGHAVAPGRGLDEGDRSRWWFTPGDPSTERPIARRDILYWPSFSPGSPDVGMSRLEPLRDTLETEAAAKAATSGVFRHGNRHSVVLKAPKSFGGNPAAVQRLRDQYQDIHGGVYNWSKPLVLEDGMDVAPISMTNEELQYIELRGLHLEEVARVFDIPPPGLQDLRRATFSNITEQNRMLYRTTMPPHLIGFEAALDFDLRDGSFGDGLPEFSERFYCELLVDGVMRGSFEERVASYATAIQTFQLMPSEVRELENRPFVEGSDVLLGNAAIEPISQVVAPDPPAAAPALPPGDAEGRALTSAEVSTVMGRLSRAVTVDDVDVDRLVAGLDGAAGRAVAGLVAVARLGGVSVPDLRQMVRRIGEP